MYLRTPRCCTCPVFFFNDTATTEIYTLSLHDALPISVVISLLNACTGLAAAATGFELENNVLIVSGMLVGASGTLLTILMGRAMNRSLANVLFGAFGQVAAAGPAVAADGNGAVRSTSADDVA